MIIELLGIVATVLAVSGVWLNNHKRIGCFYFWITSNFLCALIHWHAGIYSMWVRDGIFIGLALHGYWKWSRHGE
jgi:nicotinamide riboside transporter PnuC